MKNRCQCRNKKPNGRCRGPRWTVMNDKNICILHARYYYLNAAKTIQTIFHNNKIRSAICLYKGLPNDIQRMILFNIRENHLIKKHHHDVIEKIIEKRIYYFNKDYEHIYLHDIKYYMQRAIDLIKLFQKYYEILSDNILIDFSKIMNGIIGIIIRIEARIPYIDNLLLTIYYTLLNDYVKCTKFIVKQVPFGNLYKSIVKRYYFYV